ncbi:hypothetical protein Taro_052143, partial [Colocasia esculenta]|nr:hypothetical protein [Colocasia esculenta]
MIAGLHEMLARMEQNQQAMVAQGEAASHLIAPAPVIHDDAGPTVKCRLRMWTFRVAVALGGIGVDANLRILQVIGSPEGMFPTLFSIPLAPACCPSVPKASN